MAENPEMETPPVETPSGDRPRLPSVAPPLRGAKEGHRHRKPWHRRLLRRIRKRKLAIITVLGTIAALAAAVQLTRWLISFFAGLKPPE